MMSAITSVFKTFPPLKDSTEDSSSLRRRTRSSSGAMSVDAVALELMAEDDPAMGCDESTVPKETPFWGSAKRRKAESKGSLVSDPTKLPLLIIEC